MDLSPGERFPDLELPDHTGRDRRLSEIAGGDPLVLITSRGWWCPKEQRYLRELTRLQSEFEVAYTRIAGVSVDPPEVQSAFRAGLGARFTFLSDAERGWLPRSGSWRPRTPPTGPTPRPASRSSPTSASTRPTTATGSGAAPPWRSCARTCVRSARRSAATGRCPRSEHRVRRRAAGHRPRRRGSPPSHR